MVDDTPVSPLYNEENEDLHRMRQMIRSAKAVTTTVVYHEHFSTAAVTSLTLFALYWAITH